MSETRSAPAAMERASKAKATPRAADSRRPRSQGLSGTTLPALRSGLMAATEAHRLRGAAPAEGTGAFALLLAAHGERRAGAENEGAMQLAAVLADCAAASEVAVGFLKGSPSIADAVQRLSGYDLLVYPLFLADGYFTRTLLPRQLEEAGAFGRGRATCLLPPLGLDPALPDLTLEEASAVARAQGWPPFHTNMVLLAHGSRNNPASRLATERMAETLADRAVFARVQAAFLEEPPSLSEVVAPSADPTVVVGLFAGEGMHGGDDVPQLVAELGRTNVVSAGNIGSFAALPNMIRETIRRRWNG